MRWLKEKRHLIKIRPQQMVISTSALRYLRNAGSQNHAKTKPPESNDQPARSPHIYQDIDFIEPGPLLSHEADRAGEIFAWTTLTRKRRSTS